MVFGRSTARSFSGWVPTICASLTKPLAKRTRTFFEPQTTCRLVRIRPLSTMTTPVPTLRPPCGSASSDSGAGTTALPVLPVFLLGAEAADGGSPTTRTTDGRMAW